MMREFFEFYLTHSISLNKTRFKTNALALIAFGIIFGVLGILKFDQVPVIQAIGYWVTLCLSGFFVYTPIFYWGNQAFQRTNIHLVWLLVGLSIAAALLMCFVIIFISGLFFGWVVLNIRDLPELFLNSLLIGCIIHSLIIIEHYIQFIKKRFSQKGTDEVATFSEQALMNKLPLKLRGKLLCIKSEDHYLKIYTDKGQHLLLMRLKDAILQLQAFPGLQVHRSWWVAESAILESIKEGGSNFFVLENDVRVPISRTFFSLVKQRKLL